MINSAVKFNGFGIFGVIGISKRVIFTYELAAAEKIVSCKVTGFMFS